MSKINVSHSEIMLKISGIDIWSGSLHSQTIIKNMLQGIQQDLMRHLEEDKHLTTKMKKRINQALTKLEQKINKIDKLLLET